MTQTEWLNKIHVRLLAMYGVYRRPLNVARYMENLAYRRARYNGHGETGRTDFDGQARQDCEYRKDHDDGWTLK